MNSKVPMIAGVACIGVILVILFAMPAHTSKPDDDNPILNDTPIVNNTPVNQTPVENQTPEFEYGIELSTDKYAYKSGEVVKVQVEVTVPQEIRDAEMKLYGILNKYGAYKVKKGIDSDLIGGVNVINTTANVPSCSSCSGVSPGVHHLYVSLYSEADVEIVNGSVEIEILK